MDSLDDAEAFTPVDINLAEVSGCRINMAEVSGSRINLAEVSGWRINIQ